jgi:hypothetical protein
MASIVDTKSAAVGGGIYYVRRNLKDLSSLKSAQLGSSQRIEDRAGATGFGKLSNEFSVGATVKWGRYSAKDALVKSFKKWNFSVGGMYKASEKISLGVVGQNLLKDNKGLDPMMVTGGAEVRLIEGLALSAQLSHVASAPSDATYTFPDKDKAMSWAVGAEYFIDQSFGFRAGYKDNPTWKESTVSAGATYQAQSFSADYSFENVKNTGSKDTEQFHTVGISALF